MSGLLARFRPLPQGSILTQELLLALLPQPVNKRTFWLSITTEVEKEGLWGGWMASTGVCLAGYAKFARFPDNPQPHPK